MSNYTKSTNFATKDNLPTGDPLKIVKGTEIDTEYNNIATAIATKTDNSAAAITGGSITGITDLAVADGGTGASTAASALNNLLPSQTSNANKYLQTDGTNASWDAVTLSTADITGTLPIANGGTGTTSTTFVNAATNVTGTLPVANGGTGVTSSTGTGNVVLSNSPTLVTPALGTPASGVATNLTGLPLSTGITGLGTGVATALAINTPNIGAMVVNGGALGTPSSGTVTNLTGTASININGQVGSSTPNSGNFTTLSASSTVTISGGTVDGVAYLDASKVLTTGSVLSFSGVHLTSNRTKDTTYSGTDYTTYPNGFILQNSATPATGLFNSIYFKNNANMQNVFGVVQNSSGYGDFVWAGYSGSHTEWMRLSSSGLTLTSNPTLSGGTVNGVTYLNGSKVLTSGSALTFDGTKLVATLTTDATTTYPAYFDNSGNGSGTGSRIGFRNAGASYGEIGYLFDGSFATIINSATSAQTRFLIGGTEALRLTSTSLYTASGIDVGFGTSTPDVFSRAYSGTTVGISSASGESALMINSSGTNVVAFEMGRGGSRSTLLYDTTTSTDFGTLTSKPLRFLTNGTTVATLDSAGNLGLGVTPSAWSGFKAMQIGSTVALWGASSGAGSLFLSSNTYFDGTNFRYLNTANATFYAQSSTGNHAWNVAASGTAGNAISFSQSMTLDASGNLGVGTTSPATKLHVSSGAVDEVARFQGTGSPYISIYRSGTRQFYIYNTASATELIVEPALPLTFATNSTERARIDSSGNLYVGATALSSDANYFAYSPGNTFADFGHVSGVGSTTPYTRFLYAGSSIGSITQSGTTAVLYNVTSDQRLKENIQDAESASTLIDALQVRKFDWKADGNHQRYGFVAQELVTVAPEAVHQPTDTDEMMAVDYSKLVPMLVKEIQSLRQRVAQLETN